MIRRIINRIQGQSRRSKRFVDTYMETAYVFAKRSYCDRKKVGCVIVKNDTIISVGYNGSPSGWDNACEDEHNKTLPHILHAEENALIKLARSHESSVGAEMFITMSPCLPCAKLLSEVGLKKVYYAEDYRGTEGLEHLRARGIPVERVKIEQ